MRKLPIITLLLTVLTMSFRCEPDPPYNRGRWFVENQTGQTIVLKIPRYSIEEKYHFSDHTLAFWEHVYITGHHFEIGEELRFEYVFGLWGNVGKDSAFEVYSIDGTLLKKWIRSDDELSGKQFFNESSWDMDRSEFDDEYPHIDILWTFHITEEDIIQ